MRITYVNYAISICARLSLTAYLLCIMQIKLCISFELSSSALASLPRPRPRLRLPLRLWVSEHGHHVVVPSVQIAAGCSTRSAWLASHALSLAVVVLLNAEWDAQKDKQRQAECGQEWEREREGATEVEDLLPNELNLFFGSRFPSQIVSTWNVLCPMHT